MIAEPSRALLITNIFPPHAGGPASFVDLLAHALTERGVRISVICASDRQEEPSDKARPFRVRRVYWPARYTFEIKVRLVLLQEMLRHRVVFVNGLEAMVAPIARALGRRYILKIVGDAVWERARNLGATQLSLDEFQTCAHAEVTWHRMRHERASYLAQASRVIVPSRYLGKLVAGWGVPPTKLMMIENGTDVNMEKESEPPRQRKGVLRALFVGRLTNWKGVETLLLASQRLRDMHVTVCGDGPEYPMLSALSLQLGLQNRVSFLGRRPRAEVLALMREAHVLVLTSLYEGMSHTALDALASGLPCILSRCAGNEEVMSDGMHGMLIPPQDVDALQQALERIGTDEELRLRMAAAASKHSKRFPFSKTVDRYLEVMMNS